MESVFYNVMRSMQIYCSVRLSQIRNWFIGSLLLVIPINVVLSQQSTTGGSDKRPNIIVFMVDDMGWQDTSVPFWTERTKNNDKYHTPNMERLAKEGMKFTNAYAYPVCSPSRVSYMTGMNAARHRVTNWTLKKDTSTDAKNDVLDPPNWNLNGLSPESGIDRTVYAKSFPEILQDNGYFTIHIGKAHFGAQGTPAADPTTLGFNINIGGSEIGGPGSYLGIHNFSGVWRGAESIWDIHGLEKYHGKDIFLTEALTLEGIVAMQKALDKDRPFFLNMSHYAVHVPYARDERFIKKYLDAGYDETEAMYAALVEGMDKSLGDIMDFVKSKGIGDNTTILFISDNGGLSNHGRSGKKETQNLPLRYGKGSFWEGGIREPMIAWQPGAIAPGTVCEEPLIIEDFYTTILELAGTKKYKTPQILDGKSFLSLLKGKKARKDRALVWHSPNSWIGESSGYGPGSAIRWGDWKLICLYTGNESYLYNIKEDIGEQFNLIEEQKVVAIKLAKELTRLLKERGAQMPVIKSTGMPVPWPSESVK